MQMWGDSNAENCADIASSMDRNYVGHFRILKKLKTQMILSRHLGLRGSKSIKHIVDVMYACSNLT